MCCGAGGLCAPFLHEFPIGYGNPPQPFLHGLGLLAFYALPSSFFEYLLVWNLANHKAVFSALVEASFRDKLLFRSVKAHLLGIPLALIILLIPAHPYRGFHNRATIWKTLDTVAKNIAEQLDKDQDRLHGRFPDFKDRDVKARLLGSPENRTAFLTPELTRFRAVYPDAPLEWNLSLSGKKLFDYDAQTVWIVRSPDHSHPVGILLTIGQLDENRAYLKGKVTGNLEQLGLEPPEQP